jgi:CheY-like chemotaxis protein
MAKEIAWIEDDIDIIYPVVRPLERAGHSIVTFRNVREAIEAVDQLRRVDIILLDMLLPPGKTGHELGDYQGLQLLRDLRKKYKIKTPVIVFTVITPDNLVMQLKELGIADIVRKPVRPSELKERVERALEKKD